MNLVIMNFDGKRVAYFRDCIFVLLRCMEKYINFNGEHVNTLKNMFVLNF